MSKQLSKTDYIISIIIIFMLVCIIASFFYGVKIGKESTEDRFNHLVSQTEEIPEELTSYDQKYLVSFYHTVFLPYREFEKKWFEHMEAIELRNHTVDPDASLKELGKLARSKYEEIQTISIPVSSPLLIEAHQNYLRSLNLFTEVVDQNQLHNKKGDKFMSTIASNDFVNEAIHYALTAQENFFESIKKWHDYTYSPNSVWVWEEDKQITIKEWSNLQFNTKNYAIATMLNKMNVFDIFLPHDATANIDAMIANGHIGNMNIKTLEEAVNTLINTRAIRQGDYIQQKDRYYNEEIKPQLPFFEEN